MEAHAGGGSGFPSLDLGIDLDDGIWILVALAAVVLVIFGAGGYLIWAAPEILPEIAFNVLLVTFGFGLVVHRHCPEAVKMMQALVCSAETP